MDDLLLVGLTLLGFVLVYAFKDTLKAVCELVFWVLATIAAWLALVLMLMVTTIPGALITVAIILACTFG